MLFFYVITHEATNCKFPSDSDIICHHAINCKYPKEQSKKMKELNQSKHWGISDDELRKLCKVKSKHQKLCRPNKPVEHIGVWYVEPTKPIKNHREPIRTINPKDELKHYLIEEHHKGVAQNSNILLIVSIFNIKLNIKQESFLFDVAGRYSFEIKIY